MSSARLEVITDDPAVAPRLSRSLPAALYGIVPTGAFQLFCDKLDGLFDGLDAEQRRRKRRFWWRDQYLAQLLYVLYLDHYVSHNHPRPLNTSIIRSFVRITFRYRVGLYGTSSWSKN